MTCYDLGPYPRGLSLCSGIGGLDLGVELALPDYRAVCYVERDEYCQRILEARMRDGGLADAHVWDDLTTFDGTEWNGRVDLVTAGFPCQPSSVAGKRRGTADERWIWPDIARIIREVGPRLVFLENVPGLLSCGFGEVLGDLAEIGLDADWDVFSAAGIGASHIRQRVWILAYRRRFGVEWLQPKRFAGGGHSPSAGTLCSALGDTDGHGFERTDLLLQPRPPHPNHAHAFGASLPIFAPGPDGRREWQAILDHYPDLAPAVEKTSEPFIRRMVDGHLIWVDPAGVYRKWRLRALGNSVVPLAAAYAFRTLAARAGVRL